MIGIIFFIVCGKNGPTGKTHLTNIIRNKGYSLTDKKTWGTYTDIKTGWTLDTLCTKAHIVRMRNGYTLELPKPMSIE